MTGFYGYKDELLGLQVCSVRKHSKVRSVISVEFERFPSDPGELSESAETMGDSPRHHD